MYNSFEKHSTKMQDVSIHQRCTIIGFVLIWIASIAIAAVTNTCTTADCTEASTLIRSYLDESVSPCDDLKFVLNRT